MKKGSHCIKRADFYAEKEGFYAEKEGGGGRGGGGWGASKTRPGPDASRAGKRSPAYHGMPRGGRQGEHAPRGYFGLPQTRRWERGRGSGRIKRLWRDAQMGPLMENHDA